MSHWKAMMEELLDGVQQELGSGISNETRTEIHSLRQRLDESLPARSRKRLELELEEFLHSELVLQAATERYLGKKTVSAIEAAETTLKQAEAILQKARTRKPGKLPN
jgi:hypothetical protein